MLKDKKDPNIVAVWGSGESDLAVEMPPEWRHFGSRVEREIKGWIGVLPWLEETTGELMENFAGLRRKLSEDEAWDFLHDGAIRLAQAGHTVFLPRWWEEIKMLLPRLKIKTHSSVGSWQESRLGLNQIIQFDWNLAVGGLELSEKEFRQVVEKKRRPNQDSRPLDTIRPSLFKKSPAIHGEKR
ncbi:MAG: SNF2 helicase-associated domain-containing protein [Candidatus Syntrophopropionicum ammoniitolerans]